MSGRHFKSGKMEKMRQWLRKRGFTLNVSEKAEDCVDFASRSVVINRESSYQIKLSSLIHECGHVRIFLSRVRNPYNRICGSTLSEQCFLVGRREPRGRSSRISMLQEELDAWESGESLARSLAVRYNKKLLEKDRVTALMTYVNYTACRMRMNETEKAVRINLETALRGFVKHAVSKAQQRYSLDNKKPKTTKKQPIKQHNKQRRK